MHPSPAGSSYPALQGAMDIWYGIGKCVVDDHHFMWSVPTDGSGQCGITLTIPNHLWGALVAWKPINDHLLMAHFQHRLVKLTVMSLLPMLPNDVIDKHMKVKYYSLLKGVLENISPHDISIILMNANATIASVLHDLQLWPHTTGTVFINPACNDNGQWFLFYAIVVVSV